MKKSQYILAAAFLAASGSLQAAGAIKTYLVEAAFASDYSVDWTAQGAAPRDENSAPAAARSVAVSLSRAAGNADANSGPVTIAFPSGPVLGVAVRIQANGAGSFTDRMNAYDAAGNLLGTVNVAGTTTPGMSDNAAAFIGIRSSLKEIARVEIDGSGANGYTVAALKLGLNPIIENDWFFVNQLFQDLYGRAPSTAELMIHLQALKQGTSTRAQVAATLFQSAAFHESGSFLVKCYLALLQREPDFVQWAQILKVMQNGATQDNALAAFMSTPEYAAAFADGLSDKAFVATLHQKLLGRNLEAGDLDAWASKIAQGESRGETVRKVLRSAEFEKRFADRVNASLAYLVFLRRGGDAAGLNHWTEALKSGASVTDLVGALISMPEYAARF